MKVKDLRKAIEGLDDDVDVEIFLSENVKPGAPDYMRHVKSAKFHRASGISPDELVIEAGDYFGY